MAGEYSSYMVSRINYRGHCVVGHVQHDRDASSPFCSYYPLAHLSSPLRPNFLTLPGRFSIGSASLCSDDPYISSLRFRSPPSFPSLSLLIVDFPLAFGVSFSRALFCSIETPMSYFLAVDGTVHVQRFGELP